LLRTQTFLDLSQQPEMFRQAHRSAAARVWVVVDEVQRLPTLLNRGSCPHR